MNKNQPAGFNKSARLCSRLYHEVHREEVEHAAGKYEQVEYAVHPFVFFERIERTACRVDDAARNQKDDRRMRNGERERPVHKNYYPSQEHIRDGGNDAESVAEDRIQRNSRCRKSPNDAEQRPAEYSVECGQTKRRVRSGNQQIYGSVIEYSEYVLCFVRRERMVER